jgi:hypothetical protein
MVKQLLLLGMLLTCIYLAIGLDNPQHPWRQDTTEMHP